MKAIIVEGDGAKASDMRITNVPFPELGRGHVLIRVTYAGVNRPDILQRKGLYPGPKGSSPFMGLEVAGQIERIEGQAPQPLNRVGDFVCALTNGGGYGEYVSVDARHLLPIAEGWSEAEAATLPEALLTVYANLVEHGGLKAHETVLVHGANSGIGAMTIMMAKALEAKVIATVRGDSRKPWVTALKPDLVLNSDEPDCFDAIKTFGGADIVLDIVGGDFTERNISALKPKGRLVQVGMQKGSRVEIDLMRIMHKQAIITGSMLRPRTDDEKARLTKAVIKHIYPLINKGMIRPTLERTFSFAEVSKAHDHLESGQHYGKVALKISD
jgi:NADPH:quinone reductase